MLRALLTAYRSSYGYTAATFRVVPHATRMCVLQVYSPAYDAVLGIIYLLFSV